MQVRRATMRDVIEMQHCNLRCLPENYNLRYYYYHYLSWPHLLHVLEDVNGTIAGYVLAKLDDEEDAKKVHGHITSLAVLRTHRRLGAAGTLMNTSMAQMRAVDNAHYCSLHVRRTNTAALHLYQDTLHFRCVGVEARYYVDEEDALHMKRYFQMPQPGQQGQSDRVAYVTTHGELKYERLAPQELAKLNMKCDVPRMYAAATQQQVEGAAEGHPHGCGAGCAHSHGPAAPAAKKKTAKETAAAPPPAAESEAVDVDKAIAEIEGVDSKSGKGKGAKKKKK
jgi:ribosomal protein S18 acetylase RimI-like enzyme